MTSVRKRIFAENIKDLKAYCIECSAETKDKFLNEFLVHKLGYEKKTTIITSNNGRLFTIVELTNGIKHSNVVIFSKDGSNFLDFVCREMKSEHEIERAILKYVNLNHTNSPENMDLFKRMAPVIARHYFNDRTKERSHYDRGVLHGRRLCLFYPIDEDALRSLSAYLSNILKSKTDTVMKYQVSID